jgi:hypothetical protein
MSKIPIYKTNQSDPEDALTKKMNTVKIKEGENGATRSPFYHIVR